jgi:hypothetical protein
LRLLRVRRFALAQPAADGASRRLRRLLAALEIARARLKPQTAL